MSNSEQQPIVYKTIIVVNVIPPPPRSFCWRDCIAKTSLLLLPWLLDHVYMTWPALIS